MRNVLITLSLAGALSLSAAQPVWEWHFEKKVQTSYLESEKSRKSNLWLRGDQRMNAGVNGSAALDCNPKSYNFIANHKMLWKEFTIEMKFKLDAEPDAKNGSTLIWYGVNHFGKRDFLFKITPRKELMANFISIEDNSRKILRSFTVTSKPLDIVPGKFHTVRISSVSGGALKIYFDGVLVAAKDKAMSFSDLDGTSPKYYPLLIVGAEARMGRPRFQLNGVIDDLKIYDKAVEDDSSAEETLPQAEAETDLDLPLVLGKESVTPPFRVLDLDTQGGVVFTTVDKIFQKYAARARVKVENENLIVDFLCPVPPKYPVEAPTGSFWAGELVEFFWFSDLEKGRFQYVYNVSEKEAQAIAWNKNSVRIHDWKSNFKAKYTKTKDGYRVTFTIPCSELGIDSADTKKIYRANFTRSGKSAGGRSTWANVGHDFHNTDAYGLVVAGNYSDYFNNELDKILAQANGLKLSPALEKMIRDLKTDIAENGNNVKLFAGFGKKLKNLENNLIIHILSGKKLIISQPGFWTDDITPGMLTKPVKKFKVRMAQNTTEFLHFAVSNMTNKKFLCRIKCMDKFPVIRFDNEPVKRFPLDAGFREAVPHDTLTGTALYDALVEMPLGQLLRVAPQDTASVVLKLSSKGIQPGTYTTNIVIKSATDGFANEVIPLEVEVVPVDLGAINIDVALYNYIQARFVNTYSTPKEELIKYLVERDVNYLFCNVPGDKDMDIYPPFDANGNPGTCDFTHLDNNIDTYVRCGMPIEKMKLWFYLAMDYPGYCLTSKGRHCTYKEFSPEWTRGLKSFFDQLFAHLKEKYGILPDRVVFIPVDEPCKDFNDPKSTARKCYDYARAIKAIRPDAILMANPYDLKDDAVTRNNFTKLREYIDILAPYSGQLTPGLVKHIKSLNFKECWTYNILQKHHGPEAYRRKLWENMYYGFSTVSPYWHVDQSDGGDAFCAFDVDTAYGIRRNDYASIFADFSIGKGAVSRRQEAHYMGGEDARLIILCRKLAKGKPEAAIVEALIKKGAGGDMQAMEESRKQLLDIALKLQK